MLVTLLAVTSRSPGTKKMPQTLETVDGKVSALDADTVQSLTPRDILAATLNSSANANGRRSLRVWLDRRCPSGA